MVLAQLAGCAGRAPYADESATKNVSIHTATSSKSIFSSVHAILDIYSLDAECRAKYAGTVKLDKPSVAIGIAPDRWSHLVFDFASSSFLAGRRGHTSYELFFKPQADHHYEIEVTYHDEIYDVVLGERQPQGTLREMPDLAAGPCPEQEVQ
jgi:hypothetical protein